MGRCVRGNVDGDGQAGAVMIMMVVGENEPARMDDTSAKGEQPSEQQESCDFSDGGLAAEHLEQLDSAFGCMMFERRTRRFDADQLSERTRDARRS